MPEPPRYPSPQNSAKQGIAEQGVMQDPLHLNNGYSVAPPIFNDPGLMNRPENVSPSASVAFGRIPNNFLPRPSPYMRYHFNNNAFAVARTMTGNMQGASTSAHPSQHPVAMMHNLRIGRQIPAPQIVKKKPKRIRTAYTTHQLNLLEQEYAITKYLDSKRRSELATILDLKEKTLKIWFQNRRMKEKKDRFEEEQEHQEQRVTTTINNNLSSVNGPVRQLSPYMRAFGGMNKVASTSSANSEVPRGEGSSVEYYVPEQAIQCSPPAYEQVNAKVQHMSQQNLPVSTAPQHLEIVPESATQQQQAAHIRIFANNNNNPSIEVDFLVPQQAISCPPPVYEQGNFQMKQMPQESDPQHHEVFTSAPQQQVDNIHILANKNNNDASIAPDFSAPELAIPRSPPVYKLNVEMEQIPQQSTPQYHEVPPPTPQQQPENTSLNNDSVDIAEEIWDLSWIQSILVD